MASIIKLNQQGLSTAINQVKQAKEEYDNAIRTLGNVINSLDGVWQGDSQTAMKNRYDEKKSTFAAFSDEIGEYITGMNKTLQELPGTDQEIASMINSMML